MRRDNSNDINTTSTTATMQETIYHRLWAIKAVALYVLHFKNYTLAVQLDYVQEEVYERMMYIGSLYK